MQGINKMNLVARNANWIIRRNYGQGRKHPFPTMNDLPVPNGDFFAHHAARNRMYNAILATGIGMFSAAVYTLVNTNIINLNWSRPESLD